jgi:hypothetical protein
MPQQFQVIHLFIRPICTFLAALIAIIWCRNFADPQSMSSQIGLGVAASLLAVSLIDLAIALRKMFKMRRNHKWLLSLFGSPYLAQCVRISVPVFRLSNEVVKACDEKNIPVQFHFQKDKTPWAKSEFRIDVPSCMAGNDVAATNAILECLSDWLEFVPDLKPDEDCLQLPFTENTVINIGFSSNVLTHYLLDTKQPSIFRPKEDGFDSERVEVLSELIPPKYVEYKSTQSTQIGLIARWQPYRDEGKTASLIWCAGIGAEGTIGAASYFSVHLREIAESVKDKDFCLVLEVPKNSPANGMVRATYIY